MTLERKTIKDSYLVGNSKIRVSPLAWPVYARYELVSMYKYLSRQNKKQLERFLKVRPNFYQEFLEDTGNEGILIVPDYNSEVKEYDPLGKEPNLFLNFAQLYCEGNPPSNETILEWVHKYGLPVYKPTDFVNNNEAFKVGSTDWDSLLFPYLEYEQVLYSQSGGYAMFLETFIMLAEEMNNLFKAANFIFHSRGKEDATDLAITLSESYTHEKLLEPLGYGVTIEESVLKDIIIKGFINRVEKHITKLSAALNLEKVEKPPYLAFIPTWQVPSLFSAIILQFYEYTFTNQNVKTCAHCGKLFNPTKSSQKYCPPSYLELKSACKNAANQAKHRKKVKE